MKTGIKVLDAMTTNPITVRGDCSVEECAKLMKEKDIGGVIIVEGETLLGLITEQDLVRKVLAKGKEAIQMDMKELMEEKIVTIDPGKDIYEALLEMKDYDIRHLPVVDSGKFVGLITSKDVLKIAPGLFDYLVEKIKIKEESKKPIYHGSDEEGICELCGRYTTEIFSIKESKVCEICKKQV